MDFHDVNTIFFVLDSSLCTCNQIKKILNISKTSVIASDVTKVEVPYCMLTCNMRNEIVAVRAYQAVKNPATTDEFAADFSFMPE